MPANIMSRPHTSRRRADTMSGKAAVALSLPTLAEIPVNSVLAPTVLKRLSCLNFGNLLNLSRIIWRTFGSPNNTRMSRSPLATAPRPRISRNAPLHRINGSILACGIHTCTNIPIQKVTIISRNTSAFLPPNIQLKTRDTQFPNCLSHLNISNT